MGRSERKEEDVRLLCAVVVLWCERCECAQVCMDVSILTM